MIKGLLLLAIIVLGLLVAPLWSGNTGYVLIAMGHYTIETSLVVAGALLAILLLAIWLLKIIVRRILAGQLWTRQWAEKRRERKAIQNLRAALGAWFHRDYETTARLAEKSKNHHPDPQLAFALAGAAYGELNAPEDQRRILTEARLAGLDDESLEILQLLSTSSAEEALDLAQDLLKKGHFTPAVLRAIAEQLARFGHWDTLRGLLPKLEDTRALTKSRLHKFTRLCFQSYFRSTTHGEGLEKSWKGLSRHQRRHPAIRIAYIEVLVSKGHLAIASKVAARGLERNQLNVAEILALAPEQWASDELMQEWVAKQVKSQPEQPDILLLYAASRFASKEYELAERALRETLALRPDQYAYRLYGETLLAAGKHEQALQAFRKASGHR
ncbi:MAG: hypothetical protein JJU10_03395 [Idiomarina sp.]|nr:hypothetical protein [Idiomarina sp.]